MVDAILNAIADIESILDNEKGEMAGGVHLQLCTAVLKAFKETKRFQKAHFGGDENDNSDDEAELDGEENEESDEEQSVERTENDMGCNELSDLWEWQFDFGRRGAVMELDFLIDEITASVTPKRVCAAVRVLNRALKGSKPDDPADAERILEWKEELVAERAIRVCSEILEGVDDRGFENESHEEHWLYSVLCDEIVELFQRLGKDDALFRTKLRRNGALKGVEEYTKEHPGCSDAQDVLNMLRRR